MLELQRSKYVEFTMNYNDAKEIRKYINSIQGGSAVGTLVGLGGFAAGPVGVILGIAALTIGTVESYSGSTLESQEDFYTGICDMLSDPTIQNPTYDLIKCRQKMDYVQHRKAGVLYGEGWMTKGHPEIIGMHGQGGWSV